MARARYKRLVDKFAADIRAGNLPPGHRLSTHRQLAADEGIALVTATRIYAELEAMGLVSGEAGRGTFVRETALPPGHGIDQPATTEGMIDLNFNSPSLPDQTEILREALRQLASSGDLETLMHYQPHAGRKHERATVARHLAARGLSVDGSQVLIVSGAQHGLAATVMALLRPGDVVAVDALIYPGFKVLAEVHRLELSAIPLSDQGPDLDALEELCRTRSVRAVYAMPTLHNPMGWVLDMEYRQRLVAIARQHKLLIIEDAAYAFHAEDPPAPLAALAPETTVYVSGLSKSVATGLRVGFVAAPSQWISMIERIIRATTWNTPALMTAMSCRWIEDGTVTYLESEKRKDAIIRQSMARDILNGLDYVSNPASYFLWLPLPEEVRADQVVMALMQSNISVSTAEPFATTHHIPHAIRLALGSADIDTLQVALKKVREVIDYYSY
ncbi:PLP-dependent aminotransferase family protein [Motiliproteus sp. MSK22-1]|uniref:aminotransferase-like domain-containing protein n=1 Tax=Motiliproteus sp. MSK22-1 TaxID=1897630 RepID=UPI0009760427|nr:PLP-dependent aminotransferase family protein [Motiliproteus sp. MSK22-1]OMH29176.1 GntR family transcriptional regulator [Motiliproteus sp. MSK22-1]